MYNLTLLSFSVFILERISVVHCYISNDLRYSNSAKRIRIGIGLFEYSTTALVTAVALRGSGWGHMKGCTTRFDLNISILNSIVY